MNRKLHFASRLQANIPRLTLELLKRLRDGRPERKARIRSKTSSRSLKHGLKARRAQGGWITLWTLP
jgi:hypothetical protein